MREYWAPFLMSLTEAPALGLLAWRLMLRFHAGVAAECGLAVTAAGSTAATLINIIFGAATGFWWPAAASGLITIIAAVLWHRRRSKRSKVAELIGAKSRALRDALVRRAREAARPRRVLSPVPGGAR